MAAEGLNMSRSLKVQHGEDPILLQMTMVTLKNLLPNMPEICPEDDAFQIIMSAIEYIDYLKDALTEI